MGLHSAGLSFFKAAGTTQDAPKDLAAGLKDKDCEVGRLDVASSIGDSLCRFPRRADNEMAGATELPTGFLLFLLLYTYRVM